MIPAHHNDPAAAKDIGYKLVKISRCPQHEIWASTKANLSHPVFMAAMRYGDIQPFDGGVLRQPVTMGYFIQFARSEKEKFMMVVSRRNEKKK